MTAVRLEKVSKRFRRYFHSRNPTTLKSVLVDLIRGRHSSEDAHYLWALKDINLEVPRGTTLGIIGRNGSGKSTLLKILAGIYRPNSGRVEVNGRVSALIELGAGFHPELSGRENIFINGMILGLSRKEIRRKFDEIVAFAEIADFIDAPVRTYSSGMYARLGFSVAVNVDPDILLVDEVLSVGDEAFIHKCKDKMDDFKQRGRTIVLVTHDLVTVDNWCNEAIWLEGGVIKKRGDQKESIAAYRQFVLEMEGKKRQEHER